MQLPRYWKSPAGRLDQSKSFLNTGCHVFILESHTQKFRLIASEGGVYVNYFVRCPVCLVIVLHIFGMYNLDIKSLHQL